MTRPSELREGSHINSVWLEGIVTEEPVSAEDDDGPRCRFAIVSPWAPDQPSEFTIEAAESAFDGNRPRIRAGKYVRVIGRLRQKRWKDNHGQTHRQVAVVSELVELAGHSGTK
jgi:single-stranded DNA-binding protein